MVLKVEPFLSDRLQECHKFILARLSPFLNVAFGGVDYDCLILQIVSDILRCCTLDSVFSLQASAISISFLQEDSAVEEPSPVVWTCATDIKIFVNFYP